MKDKFVEEYKIRVAEINQNIDMKKEQVEKHVKSKIVNSLKKVTLNPSQSFKVNNRSE